MSLSDYPVGVLLRSHTEKLAVASDSRLFHAMTAMEMATKYGLPSGLSIVVDEGFRLVGIITDGDIREAQLKGFDINSPVTDVMTREPVVIFDGTPAKDVLDEIRRQIRESGRIRTIGHAVLVDPSRRVLGLVDVSRLASSQSWHWDTVGVIGLGYVGLTIAVSLAEMGFEVIGWDRHEEVRAGLRRGASHVYEVGLEGVLKAQLEKGRFLVASSYTDLKRCRCFLICVNTLVNDAAVPDLTQLEEAVAELISNLKAGDLIVLRSTVPVGTCRNLVKKAIDTKTDFLVGKDLGLAFAPERTVEGRALEEIRTLPQVIGGINDWSTEATARIFSKLSPTVVRVDTLEEAEFVKLVNNAFRDLSFAFANEIAMMCEAYNLNSVKIIKAANSGYPRNPISLPSPGVGGTCLKKDPYILASAESKRDGVPSLSEIGRRINEKVPGRIARRLLDALEECGKKPSQCTVFVLGFAFKGEPETTDMRGSSTLDLVEMLRPEVASIRGYDPIVPKDEVARTGVVWKEIEEGFSGADAVVFMTNHRSFTAVDVYGLAERMRRPAIFFDGWHLFELDAIERVSGVRYMGMGYMTPWTEKSVAS